MAKTKITAPPIPTDVSTVLEIAKYEHIPKKYAKTMFSIKTAFIKIFINSSIKFNLTLLIFYF